MMQHWTRQAGFLRATRFMDCVTFGTYLAECNMQARAVMEAMGHSSMTVTDEHLREANKKRIAVDDREGDQPEGRKAGPDEAAGGSARSAMTRNLELTKKASSLKVSTGMSKVRASRGQSRFFPIKAKLMVGPEGVFTTLILLAFSWAKIENFPVSFRTVPQTL